MTQPWEWKDKETPKAYAAFEIYRDLGPQQRSLVRVAQTTNKHKANLAKWSTRYEWVERVRAWDEHQAQLKIGVHEKAIEDMLEREIDQGLLLQSISMKALQALDGSEDLVMRPPVVLLRYLKQGMEFERLGRGVPTEHIVQEQRGGVKLTHGDADEQSLSSDDRRILRGISDRRSDSMGVPGPPGEVDQ